MKELNIKQTHPQLGKVEGIMRILGHIIFLKFNSNQYAEQVITMLQSKGAVITRGKGWIRVNMFGTNKSAKLGNMEIWLEEETPEQIEIKLRDFFKQKYLEAKFEVVDK